MGKKLFIELPMFLDGVNRQFSTKASTIAGLAFLSPFSSDVITSNVNSAFFGNFDCFTKWKKSM